MNVNLFSNVFSGKSVSLSELVNKRSWSLEYCANTVIKARQRWRQRIQKYCDKHNIPDKQVHTLLGLAYIMSAALSLLLFLFKVKFESQPRKYTTVKYFHCLFIKLSSVNFYFETETKTGTIFDSRQESKNILPQLHLPVCLGV